MRNKILVSTGLCMMMFVLSFKAFFHAIEENVTWKIIITIISSIVFLSFTLICLRKYNKLTK